MNSNIMNSNTIPCLTPRARAAAAPPMSKAIPFIAAVLLLAAALLAPTDASAYVGPGAGLSLLGALWALVAAIATAFIFILAWPVRRYLRRRRTAGADAEPRTAPMDAASESNLDRQRH